MNFFSFDSGCLVTGKGKYNYQEVLDDFMHSNFIGIITYNISKENNGELITNLTKACNNGSHVIVITNIPKRFPSYYSSYYANSARDAIKRYIDVLNPNSYGMKLDTYFDFSNHSKIIVTDNIVYIGSENYSDESKGNYESGIISRDRNLINYIKEKVFPERIKTAIPYYKYNFAESIAILLDACSFCEASKESVYFATHRERDDYDTNFETVSYYDTSDSRLTNNILSNIIDGFSKYEDALECVNVLVEENYEKYDEEELPDQLLCLEEEYNEYKKNYNDMFYKLNQLCENLNKLANYDIEKETNEILNRDYLMEAYDENLDDCIQKSSEIAYKKYTQLIENAEPAVNEIINALSKMHSFYIELKEALYNLLEINKNIDNT